MTVGQAVQPSFGDPPADWFRDLWGSHDPNDPPEATLVLAVVAAMNGFKFNGDRMPNAHGVAPTVRQMAQQLGLTRRAVKVGLQHLQAAGAVQVDNAGCVHVEPDVLRARADDPLQTILLTTRARQLGLRAAPLLLTGFVERQLDRRRGHLRLGVVRLAERLGWHPRVVERALATARKAKAIHTWSIALPGRGYRRQLFLAPGPSQSGGCSGAETGGCSGGSTGESGDRGDSGAKSAAEGVANRGSAPHQTGGRLDHEAGVVDRSQTGGCVQEGFRRDSPEQKPASPAGETRAAAAAEAEPSEPQDRPADVPATIDAWAKRYADNVCFDSGSANEVAAVATLIDAISPRPAEVRIPRAFRLERLALARRVIGWCPWPDRLGRWLVRVHRWFRVENLGAYLRRASEKGNPDTLLHSHSKNVLGRAAETWQDFTPQTERALRGPRADEIEQIVAGICGVLEVPDEDQRVHLREELARFWKQQRPVAARITLQRLVGNDLSHVAIARAADGILTHRQAKWLLRVA